jgi:syntaxin 5
MGDGSMNPYDQKGKGRAPQNGDLLSLDLNAAEAGGSNSSNGFMQMQMVEQQVCRYVSLSLR